MHPNHFVIALREFVVDFFQWHKHRKENGLMLPSPMRTLVGATGDEGRAWLEQGQRPDVAKVETTSARALALLWERRVEPANALLRTARADLSDLQSVPRSLIHWLTRRLCGVEAYYFYCTGDFERAKQALHEFGEALRATLLQDRFLLPLANDCMDIHLNRARIARNAGRFREMCEHIAISREVIASRLPLCELADGTKVDYALLTLHCDVLSARGEDARKAAEECKFGDPMYRRRGFDRLVQHLYVGSGMLAPAPRGINA